MCGVDTSFWMKSFSPIFLSLMKAADGERREEVSMMMKMMMIKTHSPHMMQKNI